jgi:hypothetical protein
MNNLIAHDPRWDVHEQSKVLHLNSNGSSFSVISLMDEFPMNDPHGPESRSDHRK